MKPFLALGIFGGLLVASSGASQGEAQPTVEAQLQQALDPIKAIDNHTHVLVPGPGFHPEADPGLPLVMRSTNPDFKRALLLRFRLLDTGTLRELADRGAGWKEEELQEGAAVYWNRNLDAAGVELALVNQSDPPPAGFSRFRWVAEGSALLFPHHDERTPARDPAAQAYVAEYLGMYRSALEEAGLSATPRTLQAYEDFMLATLKRWKARGAVAIKISNAYVRSLEFTDPVPTNAEARRLFTHKETQGEEGLSLQNHLVHQLLVAAGKVGMVVHVHTGLGRPPYLRLSDAAVRQLESTLAAPEMFDTSFVLLHGGDPDHADAAYLAIKPHVWVDTSSLPMLLPDRELRAALRTLLLYAPDKVLFGTDAGPMPSVPVGPEIHHIAMAHKMRRALYRVLAELVADKVVTLKQAIAMGQGVLRDNARRLYKLAP